MKEKYVPPGRRADNVESRQGRADDALPCGAAHPRQPVAAPSFTRPRRSPANNNNNTRRQSSASVWRPQTTIQHKCSHAGTTSLLASKARQHQQNCCNLRRQQRNRTVRCCKANNRSGMSNKAWKPIATTANSWKSNRRESWAVRMIEPYLPEGADTWVPDYYGDATMGVTEALLQTTQTEGAKSVAGVEELPTNGTQGTIANWETQTITQQTETMEELMRREQEYWLRRMEELGDASTYHMELLPGEKTLHHTSQILLEINKRAQQLAVSLTAMVQFIASGLHETTKGMEELASQPRNYTPAVYRVFQEEEHHLTLGEKIQLDREEEVIGLLSWRIGELRAQHDETTLRQQEEAREEDTIEAAGVDSKRGRGRPKKQGMVVENDDGTLTFVNSYRPHRATGRPRGRPHGAKDRYPRQRSLNQE